jgi:integrase
LNLAIHSKLRGCDLVKLKVDVGLGAASRTGNYRPEKAGRPVQFEVAEQTRTVLELGIRDQAMKERFQFPRLFRARPHLSTRQYARIIHALVSAGFDSFVYRTHSMRRTKQPRWDLRAVQLLFGHTKLESTVRDLASKLTMF